MLACNGVGALVAFLSEQLAQRMATKTATAKNHEIFSLELDTFNPNSILFLTIHDRVALQTFSSLATGEFSTTVTMHRTTIKKVHA
jgi:hypothetical protein